MTMIRVANHNEARAVPERPFPQRHENGLDKVTL